MHVGVETKETAGDGVFQMGGALSCQVGEPLAGLREGIDEMFFGEFGGGVAAMAVEDGKQGVISVDGGGDMGVLHVFAESLHP